ncbi:MAG: ATP synthase F0 subunit B [Planctomycetaceae bacterium]|nr:ATP synthase F0 subunit B [Planctomycetaceae bacterium]
MLLQSLFRMQLIAVTLLFLAGTAVADEPVSDAGSEGATEAEQPATDSHKEPGQETAGDAHPEPPPTGDAGHDEHAESGVPLKFMQDSALWSVVVFVVLLVVLKTFAWQPLIQGLDKREAGIRAAIAEAEDGRRKAQALLAEYDSKLKAAEQTVAETLAEAKRDADRVRQDSVAATQKEIDALRTRAREDIRQATNTALAEVFATVNSQVTLATERVLGRALSGADQERLVEEALSEISR